LVERAQNGHTEKVKSSKMEQNYAKPLKIKNPQTYWLWAFVWGDRWGSNPRQLESQGIRFAHPSLISDGPSSPPGLVTW